MTMKRAATIGVAVAILWLIYSSFVTVIPPKAMTVTAIGESFARINLYAKEHQSLPQSLADFPRRDGYSNRTDDGWKNPLHYEISEDGTVTLTSMGVDNKLGGTGDTADISRSYNSIDDMGRFIAGEALWLVDGRQSP
jgi:hypothetical protein